MNKVKRSTAVGTRSSTAVNFIYVIVEFITLCHFMAMRKKYIIIDIVRETIISKNLCIIQWRKLK